MPVESDGALVDQVYAALYEAIADLRVPAGERINVDQIARDLAVSPTPVREALARLEVEHIVRKRHRVGYVAAPLMTLPELKQLFALRRHVEPWVAGEAAARVRDSQVDTALLAGPPPGSGLLASAHVHDAVAVISGQESARRALLAIGSHLHIQRCYVDSGGVPEPSGEHDEVVTAICDGDPEAARSAMSRHLHASEARVIALFSPGPRA